MRYFALFCTQSSKFHVYIFTLALYRKATCGQWQRALSTVGILSPKAVEVCTAHSLQQDSYSQIRELPEQEKDEGGKFKLAGSTNKLFSLKINSLFSTSRNTPGNTELMEPSERLEPWDGKWVDTGSSLNLQPRPHPLAQAAITAPFRRTCC